jgi:hypothetical protein
MSDLLVSILIVNWNTRELVLECLGSLPKDWPFLRSRRRR